MFENRQKMYHLNRITVYTVCSINSIARYSKNVVCKIRLFELFFNTVPMLICVTFCRRYYDLLAAHRALLLLLSVANYLNVVRVEHNRSNASNFS